ncbi:MAG: HAD family hydrolase [Candidatus Thorarchaeota archaeon]|jgi:phosphoglycolate phosphatase-like HAD superfamily hydrolase
MTNKSGKTNNQTLIVFDFDGTLVFEDGTHEDFDVIRQLIQNGFETSIASRNDKYHVEHELDQLEISDLFTYVMADFRPKSYQLKHILWLFSRKGIEFAIVIFVDDYLPNIERIKADLPDVICYQYGVDISSITSLLQLVEDTRV